MGVREYVLDEGDCQIATVLWDILKEVYVCESDPALQYSY